MHRAEDYAHLPIDQIKVSWREQANDPDHWESYGQYQDLALDLAVHPAHTGRIIINYPGYSGDRDGHALKYTKLGAYMQGERLGAVVRGKGPGHPDFDGFTFDVQLRAMIQFSLEHARQICGASDPELLLMGASAGASAIAATAYEYDPVKRMLLLAPSADMGRHQIGLGLSRFRGEVHIVIGSRDNVVGGEKTGKLFYALAANASERSLLVIPGCDHQFRGTQNGIILSQAPFYAFARGEKPKFPDSERGMVLY